MEEKKSVKISIGMLVCLIVIAVLIMIIVGLGIYIYFSKNSKIETSQPIANENEGTEETKKSIKIDETKEYVYEKDRMEINEIMEKGTPYEYKTEDTIQLPFVNINSEDVKKINEEIEKEYKECLETISRQENFLEYTHMDYEYSIIEEKVLSLKILEMPIAVPGGCFPEYYDVYHIDLETGTRLKNSEILEMCDVTEAQLDEFIKTSLENTYYEIADEFYSFEEFMATCKLNDYQIFVSSEKTLEVYIPWTGGYPIDDANITYTMYLVNKI